MPKFVNRLVEVGIGKEGTRGDADAVDFWLPKTNLTFNDKVNIAKTESSYGHITDAAMTAQVVGRWAEGAIEGEINVNSFGLILLALTGTTTPSAATPEAGVTTHSYTLQNDVSHDTLTIYLHDPIGDARFARGMLNSLTMDVNLGNYLTYSADFMSRYHQTTSTQTPSYCDDYRFVHPDVTFKVASGISGLAAASAICLSNFSITFDKGVQRVDCINSFQPEDIVLTGFNIRGSLELNYEDRTWRDYMLNGAPKAVQIDIQSSKIIGTTSNPRLNIVFPKVWFSEWEATGGLGDIASQTIVFDVLYDLDNTRLWSTFDLVNTQSSY